MTATWKDTTKRITVYPAKGQTVGYVVTISKVGPHPGRHPPRGPPRHEENEHPQLGRGRQPPDDRRHARRQIPLAPATTYTVRVSGFVQATKGAKWVRFRTAPGRLPPPDALSRILPGGGHREPAPFVVATVEEMPRPMRTRLSRRLQALMLVAAAIALVVVEPFGKGDLLLQLTATRGVDTGDLPALALLLLAACLAI
jgi:hypothetical protein